VIFVDTSFWYSLIVPRDGRHGDAQGLMSTHVRESLVTTTPVWGETWTLLNRRFGHRVSLGFLQRISRTERLETFHIEREVEDEAWEWLRRHDERPYSFVDATSFALMRRLRIREALAFDGDFAAAGFVELRP
jgi:predicted nucleic acid-binding protein